MEEAYFIFAPYRMMDHITRIITLKYFIQEPYYRYVIFVQGARVSFSWEKQMIHHIVDQTNFRAYNVNSE